jgi:superfamily II DNA/RNA helicase
MAKAKISMPGGVMVEVDGTPEEVAAVLEKMQARQPVGSSPSKPDRAAGGKVKGEIPSLISQLKAEEFFKTPRGLSEVREKLAEIGHHYPVTTLSGAMQAQTRSRNLRRFKQNGKYVYVQ